DTSLLKHRSCGLAVPLSSKCCSPLFWILIPGSIQVDGPTGTCAIHDRGVAVVRSRLYVELVGRCRDNAEQLVHLIVRSPGAVLVHPPRRCVGNHHSTTLNKLRKLLNLFVGES